MRPVHLIYPQVTLTGPNKSSDKTPISRLGVITRTRRPLFQAASA